MVSIKILSLKGNETLWKIGLYIEKKGLDEKNLYLEKNDKYNKVLYKEYQEWYFLNCNKYSSLV